jgi:YD repeat-containing protein
VANSSRFNFRPNGAFVNAEPNRVQRICHDTQLESCIGTFAATETSTQPFCSKDSTPSTECACNAGFDQQGQACSGGQNNGQCGTIANPCNPGNGNKFEQQVIYRGPNGFELSLSFNTKDLVPGRFGSRWRDSFNRRVDLVDGNRIAYRPDGRALKFVSSGGAWVAEASISDRLIELPLPNPPGPKWELRVADGDLVETYDDAGTLLSIRSRAGLVITTGFADGTGGPNGSFLLDANGQPTATPLPVGTLFRFIDHFGRVIQIDRNISTFRVTKITDPAGGIYRIAYDSTLSNIASITFPDNKVRTFVYNEPANTGGATFWNALTGIIDENGVRFATFKYDTQEHSVLTEHAGGVNRYTLSYGTSTPTAAAPTAVTDPLNVTRTYNFQAITGALRNTGLTGSACPDCGPESATFDANGNPATRTDWNGNRTNYTYDLTRNLETSRTEGLTSAGAATPATRTIETQWHASFRLPTQITEKDGAGAVLRTTSMSHDANGNLLTRTITSGARSRTWTYTYNANGSVLTMDGPRTDVPDVATYTYYANDDPDLGRRGNLATITNALGHVTQITAYNAHGQPLTIVDPNGLTTTLGYDARQRLNSRNVGGETTTYDYDGAGQLIKVTLPDGSFLSYTYDPAHRLTAITDNLGNRISYTLDAMGNRTQDQVFDPVNALAQTRSRVYSNLNRLAQEIGAQSQTTAYGYDNQGNVTSIDGPLAGTVDVTTNAYDALNRLVRVTDPNAGQVNYGYNALDQLTSVSDPRSLVTSYNYDGLNNLNQLVSPDTGTTVNTYDAAGNLLTQTDAKGQVTTYVYDALNRVTSIVYQGGATHSYQFDQGVNGKGRLTQVTEPNSTTQYAYDQKGRLLTETRTINAVAYVTAYSYDAAGRMTGMTYPSGRQVTYTLDSLGRIQAISTTKDGNTLPVVSSVAYRPFGPAQGFTFGNNQTYTRGFDQDGRVASYTLAVQTFAVGFDAASRIAFINDVGTPANSNIYSYDNLDRLTNAATPGTPFAYSYDAVGNRLSKTVGSSTDNYAYDATNNRLSSITPGTGPVRSYTHDAVGSITADGANTYAYDTRGRLIQSLSVIGTTNYQLNSLGQRIRKTNTQGDTVYHYDSQGRLIAESSASSATQKEYIYLGDIPVAVIQ